MDQKGSGAIMKKYLANVEIKDKTGLLHVSLKFNIDGEGYFDQEKITEVYNQDLDTFIEVKDLEAAEYDRILAAALVEAKNEAVEA
jgi:hypothetical protein